MIIGVWQAGMALRERQEMDEPTVLVAMRQMSEVWENLFPIEQNRIMRLLIDRVQLHEDGLDNIGRTIVGNGSAGKMSATNSWPSNVHRPTRRLCDEQPRKAHARNASGTRVVVTPSGKPRDFELGGRSVTFVPLAIKRRHSSKLIVPPTGTSFVRTTSTFDLPLIRTIGKAFYWKK